MILTTPVGETDCTSFLSCLPYLIEIPMHTKHLPIRQEDLSHLLIDYIVKVWNAQVSFDKRNLVHLFWERPVFDVKANPDVVFGGWPTLWNKHLLYNMGKIANKLLLLLFLVLDTSTAMWCLWTQTLTLH